MITIADLKDRLDQYDDDVEIVFRAATERELYDESALVDVLDRLSFEPVSLAVADDVDYWESDDGEPDRLRMKALVWKDA